VIAGVAVTDVAAGLITAAAEVIAGVTVEDVVAGRIT
jgi:hypothetical protein